MTFRYPDQPRWTRDDADAGRCSGLQINTLTVREHQALLSAHDLIDLQRPRPPGPALNRLTVAVGVFVRELGLPSGIWTDALARHGWAALAAAVVVMERQGVKRRAGYLRSMLRHPLLADTVRHSLRRLVEGGRP